MSDLEQIDTDKPTNDTLPISERLRQAIHAAFAVAGQAEPITVVTALGVLELIREDVLRMGRSKPAPATAADQEKIVRKVMAEAVTHFVKTAFNTPVEPATAQTETPP